MKNCVSSLLCLFLSAAYAQEIDYSSVEFFNKDRGLSTNTIKSILCDSNGFIWVATTEGLDRFDGISFRSLKFRPGDTTSISSNLVISISEDPDKKHIWIGTENGICKIENNTLRAVNFDLPSDLGLPGWRVENIFFDRGGQLYVSIPGNGLYTFNQTRKVFELIVSLNTPDRKQNVINMVFEDETGLFWLATEQGLYSFDRATNILKPIRIQSNPQARFRSIVPDANGLWISSRGGGLLYYDRKTNMWEQFQLPIRANIVKNRIEGLLRRNADQLWVTSADNGFGVFDIRKKKFQFEQTSKLTTTYAGAIAKDQTGIIWLGTFNGLAKYNPLEAITFNRMKVSRSDNGDYFESHGFYYDHKKNKLYVGTVWADGLHINDNANDRHYIRGFPINRYPGEEEALWVTGILNDSRDSLWILTRDELYLCNKQTNELVAFSNYHSEKSPFFFHLFESSDGTLWVGSLRQGLFKLNRRDKSLRQFKHSNDSHSIVEGRIHGIAENEKGELIIATSNGLSVFRPKENHFDNYQRIQGDTLSLPNNNLTDVIITAKKKIWLMTAGSGIVQCDEGDGRMFFRTVELPGTATNTVVSAASCADGKVMVLTLENLVLLDQQGRVLYNQLFKNPVWGAEIWVDPNTNIIYFDGTGGYFTMDPKALDVKRKSPPTKLAVTSCKILYEERPLDFNDDDVASLELPYYENSISFELAVLDFTNSVHNRYSHFLENFDRAWIKNDDNRYVNYTNLAPGEYTLKIQGETSLGNSTQELRVHIRIDAPFWASWWFRLSMILILASLVYLFYKLRVSRKIINAQLTALRAQMNPHFLFNCLASINSYVIKSEQKKASEFITKFARLTRSLLENASPQTISIKSELEHLRLYMEIEAMRFREGFDFDFDVDAELDLNELRIPSLVIQPFVENAIHHGLLHKQTKGNITIKLSKINSYVLRCSIKDDGVGRAADARLQVPNDRKSLGIMITSERLRKLNGKMEITDLTNESGEPVGTCVSLSLPIVNSKKDLSLRRRFYQFLKSPVLPML